MTEVDNDKYIFRIFVDQKYYDSEKGFYTKISVQPRVDYSNLYDLLKNEENAVVIYPIFTQSAYSENGFYDYYHKLCDEQCLEVPIRQIGDGNYNSSDISYQVLKILGYPVITDVDVDRDPTILDSYDKVIVLHNEYVTKKEFNAITSHTNVIYLYPNALYAEVQYDESSNKIKLIRGHNYPEQSITNGFDWESDNSSQEYDTECFSWQMYEIKNGLMLNCYPEQIIFKDAFILMAIKHSDDPFWWNISQKYGTMIPSDEYQKLKPVLDSLNTNIRNTESQNIQNTENQNIPKNTSDGGCLIATATYGSELAPQIQQLRELRDEQLLRTESGSNFMYGFNQFYYSFSPTIADWERESPVFKESVRIAITPMIYSISMLNYVDMDSEAKVLGYGISLILLNVGMYLVAPAVVIYKVRKFKFKRTHLGVLKI
ncbi:CFI-box-CTERM domain-containing protein [Candidatus Nitrosotenuis chungbukensis]|uniref:CFI-box-CTERM domain-containing protein n=1 Tax=Candidatus Nitrosotenuis chungbukensis TaxID=1353246 RepID=UPI001EE6462C|nr:CFI-box-CTERM domain-containing protein [Candidatus Nitrosotenuis chungbukensis]WKT58531.1 CFI-box-CTERM domain-containing protein [Candidatus Nitrosotenuis chungbukensis]